MFIALRLVQSKNRRALNISLRSKIIVVVGLGLNLAFVSNVSWFRSNPDEFTYHSSGLGYTLMGVGTCPFGKHLDMGNYDMGRVAG